MVELLDRTHDERERLVGSAGECVSRAQLGSSGIQGVVDLSVQHVSG